MFGKPQGWYISYIPWLAVVYQLYTTAAAFDLRCESVTYLYIPHKLQAIVFEYMYRWCPNKYVLL